MFVARAFRYQLPGAPGAFPPLVLRCSSGRGGQVWCGPQMAGGLFLRPSCIGLNVAEPVVTLDSDPRLPGRSHVVESTWRTQLAPAAG